MWFPFVWVLALAGVCAWFWRSNVDPGLTNTVINFAVALGVIGLAVWTVRRSGWPRRTRWILAATPCLLLTAYYMQLLPIEMINNGDVGVVGWRWRWAEPDRALSPRAAGIFAIKWRETPQDYPRFLGTGYWAEAADAGLDFNWTDHPPRQLWRGPIGAGWSGFAVVGPYAVTQEQRGENELATCYEVRTGRLLWSHADRVRWDPRGGGSLGGVGPRATPTAYDGRVLTHGATGILNCFDMRSAKPKLLWSRDTLAEHNAANVLWGKAGSPLVVDGMVVVSVGGADDGSLAAYDLETGEPKWSAGELRSSYASPLVTELAGERQILSLDEGFLTAHRLDDGRELWRHDWPSGSDSSAASSQPVPVGGDRVLLSMGYGAGAELIHVTHRDDGWSTETVWKKSGVLKTKMGNVVVRDGFAYGLNDVNLQCVDLESGRARWTKRRRPTFGHGQLLLVGGAILVLSESGELAAVEASPKKYRELGSVQAIEGVTWNNPALAGNLLLVRNAEEAACFELPMHADSTEGDAEPAPAADR